MTSSPPPSAPSPRLARRERVEHAVVAAMPEDHATAEQRIRVGQHVGDRVDPLDAELIEQRRIVGDGVGAPGVQCGGGDGIARGVGVVVL